MDRLRGAAYRRRADVTVANGTWGAIMRKTSRRLHSRVAIHLALAGLLGLAMPAAAGTGGANVTGTQTVSGDFLPGGRVTYTIVLTNSGAADQPDNPGVEFAEVVMWPVRFVSIAATSGSGRFVTGKPSMVFWDGAIPAGGSVTLTLSEQIEQDPRYVGVISRQGTIYFDSDGNGTNDSVAYTDDPTVPGPSDPTVFTIRNPRDFASVPGLSDWSALLLVLGLAGIGSLCGRRLTP